MYVFWAWRYKKSKAWLLLSKSVNTYIHIQRGILDPHRPEGGQESNVRCCGGEKERKSKEFFPLLLAVKMTKSTNELFIGNTKQCYL
jgi:hypothetical protein